MPYDPFSVLGAGGTYDPSLGLLMATQPDVYAQTAAANGIPPPPISNVSPMAEIPSLGESMVPMPRSRPEEAGAGGTEAGTTAAPSAAKPAGSNLLSALRGITPPAAPAVQRITTPHAPTLTPIQAGQLFQLLQTLGVHSAGPPVTRPLLLR